MGLNVNRYREVVGLGDITRHTNHDIDLLTDI